MKRKQKIIMQELNESGTITLARAVELVGGDIFINREKYVGQILSRMVRAGLLVRAKPGVFTATEQTHDSQLRIWQ
jgi:hypothetical protein